MSVYTRDNVITPVAAEGQLQQFQQAQVLMLEDFSLEQLAPLTINQHAIPFSMIILFFLLIGVFSVPYLYFGGTLLLQLAGLSVFFQAAGFTFPIWGLCYMLFGCLDRLLGSHMLVFWLRSLTSVRYHKNYQEVQLAKQLIKQKLLQQVKIERSDILVRQVQSLLHEYKKLYYDVELSESENLTLRDIHMQLVEIIHQLRSLTEGVNLDIEPLLSEWRETNQCYQQALLDYQRATHSPWFNLKKYKTKKTPAKNIRKHLWFIVFWLVWLIFWLWYISKF